MRTLTLYSARFLSHYDLLKLNNNYFVVCGPAGENVGEKRETVRKEPKRTKIRKKIMQVALRRRYFSLCDTW